MHLFAQRFLAIIFIGILAAPALAQQDGAPTDATASEPSQTAEPTANADAPAEPEISREVFQDWEVRCAVEQNRCLMYYLAKDANGNNVAEVRIEALPQDNDAAAGVTVTTPLNTLLSNGLVIRIDTSQPLQYPYTWCSRSGCFARFGLRSEELNAFRRGNKAVILVASIADPDTAIPLEVSLSGFTAAFDALRN